MEEFSATRYSSSQRNILARIKLLLMKALKEQIYLPKAIIFVLDDDVIKQSNIPHSDAKSGEYKLIVKYLMEEVHHIIANYKEKLPTKSKQDFYPHCIWVIPPPPSTNISRTMHSVSFLWKQLNAR